MTDWTQAACIPRGDHWTDLWHDVTGSGGDPVERKSDKARRIADAKAFCADCPVRVACAQDAEVTDALPGPHGIRAGLTGDERRRARRMESSPLRVQQAIA